MDSAKDKLIHLLDAVVAGTISVWDFSNHYEMIWNFELKHEDLASKAEAEIFKAVFDEVVWYAPSDYEDNYPGYRDETTIIKVAKDAIEELSKLR